MISGSDPVELWASRVRARVGAPLDEWAVAAVLESEGLRDVDARDKLGHPDLFAFARQVFVAAALLEGRPPSATRVTTQASMSPTWWRTLRELAAGSAFATPMLAQIVCLVLTGYSLCASLSFTQVEATVVSLATITSLVATGGVVMVIGRQGTMYRTAGAYASLLRACGHLAVVGARVVALVALAGLVIELLAPIVDGVWFAIGVGYFLAMSALWLSLAVLSVLEKNRWSVLLTVAGSLLVRVLVANLHANVILAQIVALSLTASTAFAVGRHTLVRWAGPGRVRAHAPPSDASFGMLLPYAVYGFGYFTLLVLDRVMVWTAPGRTLPQRLWFHSPYELGFDWALLSLLAPMAYLEYVAREFGRRMDEGQRALGPADIPRHREASLTFCRRSVAVLAATSVSSVLLVHEAAGWLRETVALRPVRDLFANPITEAVFWPAALGYQLLACGLMIALLLFTLGRSFVVVRALWRSIAVAAVIGYATSRVIAPECAVLGFVAGTAAFAAQMLRAGRALARHVDYFFYAAY